MSESNDEEHNIYDIQQHLIRHLAPQQHPLIKFGRASEQHQTFSLGGKLSNQFRSLRHADVRTKAIRVSKTANNLLLDVVLKATVAISHHTRLARVWLASPESKQTATSKVSAR